MADTNACPACSNPKSRPHEKVDGVVYCQGCGALYTEGGRHIYVGESYELVSPHWETSDVAPGEERYFDLMVLGSDGEGRRHGWYYPPTRRITQVG